MLIPIIPCQWLTQTTLTELGSVQGGRWLIMNTKVWAYYSNPRAPYDINQVQTIFYLHRCLKELKISTIKIQCKCSLLHYLVFIIGLFSVLISHILMFMNERTKNDSFMIPCYVTCQMLPLWLDLSNISPLCSNPDIINVLSHQSVTKPF